MLIPHALTDWTEQGRFQGWSDTGLNAAGQSQAAALARYLEKDPIDTIVTSDRRRARETADALGRPIRVDARLRELSFGEWEGHLPQEIDAGLLATWGAGGLDSRPPGGESLAELAARVDACLGEFAALESCTAVVGHRGFLRVLLCLSLGMSPEKHWSFRLDPASVSELVLVDGAAVLMLLNNTHHLREAPDAR